MGLHDKYFGSDTMPEPANRNEAGPWCGPEHARMHAELADFRKILGMPEPEEAMRIEGCEHVTSKPRVWPARNYRDDIGGDDAE